MEKRPKASRGEDKRARIVDAATALFARYGVKRTSIDLLAAEAGIAKPTVYAYFEDKDAIFVAVAEHVCARLYADAKAAAEAPGTIEERLTAMLSAKHTSYWELVQASPHARELVDSQNALAAAIVEKADRAYVRLVSDVIAASELRPDRIGLGATAAANLLVRATAGASHDATTAQSHRRHVAEIVRVLCLGLR